MFEIIKSRKTLQDAAVITAAIQAGKSGISVVYGAPVPTACTDGKVIKIPALDYTEPLTADVLEGYVDHEVAHVIHTEFGAKMSLPPQALPIYQGLEDIRIERERAKAYPGVPFRINRLIRALMSLGEMADPAAINDSLGLVSQWIAFDGRRRYLSYDSVSDYGPALSSVMDQKLPGLRKLIEPLRDKVTSAKSTTEVVSLTTEIMAAIKDWAQQNQPPPQQQPQPPPDQSSDPESSDAPPQDQAESQSPPQQPENDDQAPASEQDDSPSDNGQPSGDPSTEPTAEDSQESDGGQSGTGPDSGEEPGDQTGSKAQCDSGQAQSAQQLAAQCDGSAPPPAVSPDLGDMASAALVFDKSHAYDQPFPLKVSNQTPSGRGVNASAIDAHTIAIKARLQMLLQSKRYEPSYLSDKGTRVSSAALTRIFHGDARIFTRRDEVKAINTHVHLLVDTSGSMGDPVSSTSTRVQLAMEAAYLAAKAASMVPKTTITVTAFPGSSGEHVNFLAEPGKPIDPRRFVCAADHGTPLSEALMAVAPAICARPEKRKIVIVVTDGQPNTPDMAKEVIRLFTRSGIEMVGLGIEEQSVHELFPTATVINDVAQLSNALMQCLSNKLSMPA